MRALGAVLVAALLTSCATLDQSVRLAPVSTSFPVSASRSLYVGGKVLGPSDWVRREDFSVTALAKVPFGARSTQIDFGRDLKRQMDGTDYNGITQLKIVVDNVDSSATMWIAAEQGVGAAMLLGGASAAIYSTQPDAKNDLIPGLVVAGVGGGLLAFSVFHSHVATVNYTFGLSGLKVKY